MAHNNANLCARRSYCEFGAYCKKVHPKIQENLKKTHTQPSAVEVEIFKANGSGANCSRND